MAEELNGKQAAFVAHYLVLANATKAATAAGYSAKTAESQGSRLLKVPKVRAAIAAGQGKQAERLELTAERVLLEYMRIGYADVADAYDEAGNLKPMAEIPEDLRRAIAGVDVVELPGKDGEPGSVVKKLKFWPKPDALIALGKHLQLFVEIQQHQGPGGKALDFNGLSDEDRAARLAALLDTARARRGR